MTSDVGPEPRVNDAPPYGGGDPYADYRGGSFPFTDLVNLADRRLGAGVVAANDEFFAERENLLNVHAGHFDPERYGHKGKIMDGWETRRRRGADFEHPFPRAEDHDWALIRLGAPGVIAGIVVDTAHFRGNYPQQISIQAAAVAGSPSPEELLGEGVKWVDLVPRVPVRGHAANGFPIDVDRRFTHVRLNQHPDGGVARLRVYGEVVPDPSWLRMLGTCDVLAAVNGGRVEDASDRFFSPPINMIAPGLSGKMDDGWENRRRRNSGNDWVRFTLAAAADIRAVEVDTAYYKGNAAGWVALHVCDSGTADPLADDSWTQILPRTRLQPDALHRFALDAPARATHVRMDVFPDGGISRLHLYGSFSEAGVAELSSRFDRLTR